MAKLTICSWNINGLRASIKTGDFQRWLTDVQPDVIGLQEVKAAPDQVDDCWSALGYESHWHTADRPGYSGALLLSRPKPAAVRIGLGIPEFDVEGRVIQADYGDLTVLTSYFPNAGRGVERMDYKLRFYASFLDTVDRLVALGRHVVFMGDFNVAHTEMDVARPQEALKGTGFLPEERAWLDRIVASGYADTFRRQHPDERDTYSYWDPWRDRRARNIGWRIDYVFVDEPFLPNVRRSFIHSDYMGSDHCPVGIELEL
jgi:exodeoxyribonuclease III